MLGQVRLCKVRLGSMSQPARRVRVERYSAFAQTEHTHNATWANVITNFLNLQGTNLLCQLSIYVCPQRVLGISPRPMIE